MSKLVKPTRILAIDPGTRDMGIALFEGYSLVRYWVKDLRKEKAPEKVLKGNEIILDLIMRFSPGVIVMGKITHPRNKKNLTLRKLVAQIRLLARKNKVRIYEYDHAAAREIISQGEKPTKKNTAILISLLYPELSEYVPQKPRVLWKEKDYYWVNVFDACTLALAYLEEEREGEGNQYKQNDTKILSQRS